VRQLAVGVANYGPTAGINNGVELRVYQAPPAPAWTRTSFNGYAQVIVPTTKEAGAIELGARGGARAGDAAADSGARYATPRRELRSTGRARFALTASWVSWSGVRTGRDPPTCPTRCRR
jgi:hypothetical protein